MGVSIVVVAKLDAGSLVKASKAALGKATNEQQVAQALH